VYFVPRLLHTVSIPHSVKFQGHDQGSAYIIFKILQVDIRVQRQKESEQE
jgi:hypothetical protein